MYLDIMRAWLGLIVLAFASYGAGSWIERMLPSTFSNVDRLTAATLGGLALLGAGLFVIGIAAFTPAVIVAACGLAAVVGFVTIRRRGLIRVVALRVMPEAIRLPALIIASVLVVTALAGSSEVLGGIGHDGISYHLLGPKVWLRDGVIRPVLGNTHTAFPATLEVVYGLSMVLGGPKTPGLSAVLTLALFLGVAAGVARRMPGVDREGAWWCAALLAAMPAVYVGAHSGFVDVFYAALVLLAARIGLDATRASHFVACGLFCGFAMATKYTGIIAAPLIMASVLFMRSNQRAPHKFAPWRGIVLSVLASALPPAAFYMRNAIVLGCPIYPPPPILSDICTIRYVSAEWVRDFQNYILFRRGAGFGRDWAAYLALPFNLTYRTAHFHGAGGIGLSALALGPVGLVALRRDAVARTLALLAWALLTVWFLTQQESRFLIPVYAISTIFAVAGWRRVNASADVVARWLCAAVLAASVAYGGTVIMRARWSEVHAALSSSYAVRRVRDETPHYEAFAFLNERATSRVMVMSMHIPAYYLNAQFLLAYDGWRGVSPVGVPDDQVTLAKWHQLGVEYLLDVQDEWGQYAVPRTTSLASLVFERGGARVYRVR